tara:strand:- start:1708 stop:3885 length:2178 start_codon:yes stop_codon:yes gene_type:complete
MPLNLASPGIVIREVDLTVGRADATSGAVGALVAPFAKGPVEDPILITDEGGLLKTFGESYNSSKHYEYWMVASSYLAYGGNMRIVRADDDSLTNAYVGAANSIKIKSTEHYGQLGYQDNTITNVTFAAKNPGSWANDLKVAILDSRADQIISGVVTNTAALAVGYGVTQTVDGTLPKADGTTVALDGHLKGIITGISGDGSSSSPYEIEVKVLSHVSAASTETEVDYQAGGLYKFDASRLLSFHNGGSGAGTTTTFNTPTDWFDQQEIVLTGPNIKWNNVVERPGTSDYAAARNSRFDEVHVLVYDDKGHVTGNAGTILEKHVALSKAKDAEYSLGSPAYWRSYLYTNSDNLFGGSAPAGIVTSHFSTGFTQGSDTGWDQNAQGIKFAGIGNTTLTLGGGKNYDDGTDTSATNAFVPELNKLVSGYSLFENADNFEVDFLLMGSGNHTEAKTQALASKLIAVAEARQDAIAFISPYRQAFLNDSAVGTVTVNSDSTITDNLVAFYGPITSSSYGVFDSGYKYMYDRFNDTFRYVPLNGDIAGLCARNDLTQFPWFSPAGTARGAILNAVKLPYNPSKVQRDTLYSNRINPVIFSPGEGIVLFGDKTGMAKSSAFDRINVRRLFIYLEDAISAAARDQLFEFNDEITRTNFVNIVEPFLRDVQSKRGIFDYVVVCDETNNTAAVIDNNEFVADIFIKPNRSINFIGLTFVATRTGVSFSEVVGNV